MTLPMANRYQTDTLKNDIRGYSSIGRALAWHARGQGLIGFRALQFNLYIGFTRFIDLIACGQTTSF